MKKNNSIETKFGKKKLYSKCVIIKHKNFKKKSSPLKKNDKKIGKQKFENI